MLKRIFIAALVALVPSLAFGQVVNWGDYQDSNQTIYLYFNTTGTDGVAETLTSGAVEIYEDGSTTQITSAETLTASFDSIVGFNQLAVDLNDAGFETGKTYTAILTAGTVDSVSVTGRVVGVFSVGRYDDAPANFANMSIDGNGRVDVIKIAGTTQTARDIGASVLLSSGTGTGQISLTSGIASVNTTQWGGTAVASANVRADMRQVLGTTLTDVGSGDFGSTLAGNISVLFGQATNESNTAIGASEINNILTRTNRIPNIAAGSSGGILIAGSNAATTFSTLTSTGAFTVNGSTLATSTALATVDGIIDNIFTGMELDGSVYRWTTNALEQAPSGGGGGFAMSDLVADDDDTAGTWGYLLSRVITTDDELTFSEEAIAAVTDAAQSSYQNRANFEPAPGFATAISRRADGTYKATKPIRLTAGAVTNVFVFVDMSPLFGRTDFVETVGAPVVSGGSITATSEGPRDTYAVVELDGTATAGEERTVTVPVTMKTGTTISVVFDIIVFD